MLIRKCYILTIITDMFTRVQVYRVGKVGEMVGDDLFLYIYAYSKSGGTKGR